MDMRIISIIAVIISFTLLVSCASISSLRHGKRYILIIKSTADE